MSEKDKQNTRSGGISEAILELQSKIEQMLEYIDVLRRENIELNQKVREYEREIAELKQENARLRENGSFISAEEREEMRRHIIALIERIEKYL